MSHREDPNYDLILLLWLDTILDQDPFRSKVMKIFWFWIQYTFPNIFCLSPSSPSSVIEEKYAAGLQISSSISKGSDVCRHYWSTPEIRTKSITHLYLCLFSGPRGHKGFLHWTFEHLWQSCFSVWILQTLDFNKQENRSWNLYM